MARRSFPTLVCLTLLSVLLGDNAGGPPVIADTTEQVETLAPEREAELREAARLRSAALADMEGGNFGRAAAHLEQLAALLPENVLPPVNLAICYFRLDRSRAAREQIDRARQIDPENPQMLYTFARLLERDPADRTVWEEVVEQFAVSYPGDPRPYYLQALRAVDEGRFDEAVRAYALAQKRAPENLVLMVERLVAAAEAADLGATGDALDAIEDRLNGFEDPVASIADRLRDLIDEEQIAALRPQAQILRNLLRPSELYQLGLIPLTGGRGNTGALFPQLDFDPPLPKSIQGGQDIEVAFVDASVESGFSGQDSVRYLRPYRGSDVDRVAEITSAGLSQRRFEDGRFETEAVTLNPQPDGPFLSFDFDQDGISDIASLTQKIGVVLHLGTSESGYGRGQIIYSDIDVDTVENLFPLDLDHDGDLDLFLARRNATDLYLQNNGDGTWSERARELELAGGQMTTTDLAVADFDDDGDLDLAVSRAAGPPSLYLNPLRGPFTEASTSTGLTRLAGSARGIETADFDDDGRFDLLLWGPRGLELLANRPSGFELVELDQRAARGWSAAAVADFDNDGDQDVMAVDSSAGTLMLLRNRRSRFELEETAVTGPDARQLFPGDLDHDGDLDLAVLLGDGRRRFWRNEGANRNQWVKLRLRGLYDNNSKNNTQGLFVRVETRVGDTVHTVVGNGGNNLLGLGSSRQADVVRVVWTNGLAQTWLQVAAKQSLVEKQVLKGSCPMLFTWNGEGFEFHTDLMWRSTLGMQLADGSTGSHLSARDYVLIPGHKLASTDGWQWLQITEELWETLYIDQTELIAVDHPVDVELVVDERFTAPPYPRQAPIHWLGERLEPVAATDQNGSEVLDRLLHRDEIYVDDLPLSRYQGLTDGHELRLTFENVPGDQAIRLMLWGWIFPTDSSINFALAQSTAPRLAPPALEIRDPDGSWRTLLPFLGFPNGKRKALVVDLTDRLPSGTITLRISTSMQIYWDAAVLAVGAPRPDATVHRPVLDGADLHYRGFSRQYRDSATGPHLFDYDQVSVDARFRDMSGAFTRYGDVEALVHRSDNRYVIMNAGDELSLRFDARELPPLPAGWQRDYILYTDGWVKDADLHTAYSQTVAPLPHHGMNRYSPAAARTFLDSDRQRSFVRRYQSRQVNDRPFRDALRHPQAALIALQRLDLATRE